MGTLITNAVVLNVFTGEFMPGQEVRVEGGRILWVGRAGDHEAPTVAEPLDLIDAQGMTLVPGLIDGHTHVFNLVGVEQFVRSAIPTGVTTVVTETVEIPAVSGSPGLEEVVRALRDQPLRFYFTVPPLCGLTAEEESMAPPPEQLVPFLEDRACVGVGEVYWGNLLLEGPQGERVRELARLALDRGKRVEGHTAGASGGRLQAYTALGVSSCHEPITDEQVLDRLRLGYWVLIRQGGVRKELPGVRRVFDMPVDRRRLALCTDSQEPGGFIREGYLDAAVRVALSSGAAAAEVYQMVTLNVAEHFRLDHLVGSIAPGRRADLVMIPSPDDYSPRLVMCDGAIVFRDGQLISSPRRHQFPLWMFSTVRTSRTRTVAPVVRGPVRVMDLVSRLVTREEILDACSGLVNEGPPREDLLLAVAVDRLRRGASFTGLLKGFGLRRGACGSTVCWDTGDLLCVGRDPASIETAVGRLEELGGGLVFAIGDQVVAEYPAPLCGVVSMESMESAATRLGDIEDALRREGVPWEKPWLTVSTLGTAAIPHLRLTHRGYVRLKDRALLPLAVHR